MTTECTVLHLVAHGTRSPAGQGQLEALAAAIAGRLPRVDVRLSYVDVLEPRIGAAVTAGSVIVPLLLSTGYHVRVDIAQAAVAGRAIVTAPLGPDPLLTASLRGRIPADADAVVLAAAGSSDPVWRADIAAIAASLGARVGYAAGAGPQVCDVVAQLRQDGARRVAVAAYLLAEGRFYRALYGAGADHVTAPLIEDPAVRELIVTRFSAAARLVTTANQH